MTLSAIRAWVGANPLILLTRREPVLLKIIQGMHSCHTPRTVLGKTLAYSKTDTAHCDEDVFSWHRASLNWIVPTHSGGVMNGLVIGACLSRYPAELASYVAFKAALQPIVQSYDRICRVSRIL